MVTVLVGAVGTYPMIIKSVARCVFDLGIADAVFMRCLLLILAFTSGEDTHLIPRPSTPRPSTPCPSILAVFQLHSLFSGQCLAAENCQDVLDLLFAAAINPVLRLFPCLLRDALQVVGFSIKLTCSSTTFCCRLFGSCKTFTTGGTTSGVVCS